MNDYEYLRTMSIGIAKINTYGTSDADITGVADSSLEFLQVQMTKGTGIRKIATNLVGEYNLPNVLVAVAIGKYFDVPEAAIQFALENYVPSNSRSQLIEKDSNKIILDAYNANPTSMKAAIENFAKMEGSDKVLMLGGMMELGEDSIQEHEAILNLISQNTWRAVVLVGGDFGKVSHPYTYFENSTTAAAWLQQQHFTKTKLLIKGSRSMQMEKVIA